MDIVCFGQQNWDYCWTGKQQLMSRLARRGHRVLYVDPAQDKDAVESPGDHLLALAPIATEYGLRREGPDELYVYTYAYAPLLRWRGNLWRHRRAVAGQARKLGFDRPVAISLRPEALPMMRAVEPGGMVYYAVDEMTAFGDQPEPEQRRRREREEALLRSVDVALGVSPRLHARFKQIQPRSYHLENGSDYPHFEPGRLARAAPHARIAQLPHPRLGFVGQVDERLDQPLLQHLARRHRDWAIVLCGRVKPGVDVGALEAEPNIHLLGYQPYDTLPSVLREVDVCLVPYVQSDLTQSCNPLKVYEYLATGRPVVSTPLDGLRVCRDVIALADGPAAFEQAVAAALADPAAGRPERLERARAHRWERRVDALEAYFEEARELAAEKAPAAAQRPTLQVPTARAGLQRRRRVLHWLSQSAGWAYYGVRLLSRLVRGRRPLGVQRILVARYAALGDLVAFLPTLAALRKRFPHAHITFGAPRDYRFRDIVMATGHVDEVREIKRDPELTGRERLREQLALWAAGYDLVITGSGDLVAHEAFQLGAPWMVGLDSGDPVQVLNRGVLRHDPTRHETDDNLALAEALGARVPPAERVPSLPASLGLADGERPALLERLGLPGHADIVVVHAGSRKPTRRWPVERFAELLARLLAERPGLHAVLSGSGGERELQAQLRERLPAELRPRVAAAAGATDLDELVGLLRGARVVISNDTGVMHLARAAGAPLLALLGPENHRRWGPYPRGDAPAIALRHGVPCAPCARWDCGPLHCLKQLTVDEALDAARELLDGRAQPGLDLRLQRESWAELAAAGAEVPHVAVVVTDHPALVGATDGDAAATLQSLSRQLYPNLTPLLATRSPVDGAADEHIELPDEPIAAWRRIAAETDGDAVVVVPAGATWPRDYLGRAVAELMRDGAAAGADGQGPVDLAATPALAGVVLRREALDEALAAVGDEAVAARVRLALG